MIYKITIVFLITFFLCGCEQSYNEYKNIAEAEKDRAVLRGWVPEYLPKTSYNIREIHELDNNELWGKFNFRGKPKISTIRCQTIDASNLVFPALGSFSRSIGYGLYDYNPNKKFSYYGCGKTQFIAIGDNNVGYYWYISHSRLSELK